MVKSFVSDKGDANMAKITSKQTFEMGISVGKNLLQVEYWSQYGEHGKVTK
jgi:hypothetical protein